MFSRCLEAAINWLSVHAGMGTACGLLVFEDGLPMWAAFAFALLCAVNAALAVMWIGVYREALDDAYPEDGWRDV